MLTRDQIQEHIDQLDAQIPQKDAELVISYGGDPADSADCEIVGNYIGYLRFGVEMLKAAIVEAEPGVGINISLGYMEVVRWASASRELHDESMSQRTLTETSRLSFPLAPGRTTLPCPVRFFWAYLSFYVCWSDLGK
jgi:hypothetical protein